MMKIPEIETFAILLLILTFLSPARSLIVPDACLQFEATQCKRCRRQTHLYDGLCYQNILGCLLYKEGDICTNCQSPNFQLANDGGCRGLAGDAQSTLLRSSLYKYSGEGNINPGDQYGESNFIPSSYEEVKNWPTFLALDSYIRKGEYSHYISRMSNPVFSVHYYQQASSFSYKLLYYGSGGGLFLCIADITSKQQVSLRSLTPISASDIIYNCVDYDVSGRCMGCRNGNHLEGAVCYANYGGCLRYLENLCLECLDYYLLVENRCVSDCLSLSDSMSILYYDSYPNRTTLQIYYKISISTFYNTRVTTSLAQSKNYTTVTISKSTVELPAYLSASTTTSTKTVLPISSSASSSFSLPSSNSAAKVDSTTVTRVNGEVTAKNSTYVVNNFTFPSQLGASSSSYSIVSSSAGPVTQKSTSSISSTQVTLPPNSLPTLPSVIMPKAAALKDNDILSLTTSSTNTIFVDPLSSAHMSNQHCLSYQDQKCVKCTEYYFVNQIAICEELSPLCVEVNPTNGSCQRCFSGYVVSKGRCDFKLF